MTIETGAGISDANSYVTLAEARAFATLRGVTLPADDAACEILAIHAMDFLEAQRPYYQGAKLTKEQALQWPRSEVVVDGFDVEEDEIPKLLKDAQCQLMMETFSGLDLQPNGTGREVVREKVGEIETEYASTGSGVLNPIFSRAEALLQPLFGSEGSGVNIPIIHA